MCGLCEPENNVCNDQEWTCWNRNRPLPLVIMAKMQQKSSPFTTLSRCSFLPWRDFAPQTRHQAHGPDIRQRRLDPKTNTHTVPRVAVFYYTNLWSGPKVCKSGWRPYPAQSNIHLAWPFHCWHVMLLPILGIWQQVVQFEHWVYLHTANTYCALSDFPSSTPLKRKQSNTSSSEGGHDPRRNLRCRLPEGLRSTSPQRTAPWSHVVLSTEFRNKTTRASINLSVFLWALGISKYLLLPSNTQQMHFLVWLGHTRPACFWSN